jgi:hypothetical protein
VRNKIRGRYSRISFIRALRQYQRALALNFFRGGRSPAANGVGTGEFWAFWAKTLQKAAEMDGKVGLRSSRSLALPNSIACSIWR